MHTTPASLLERLRQPAEAVAWARFVELYTPLLFYWARRAGLQEADAADLVQDVLTLLVQKLPAFRYEGSGGFRNWLRTLTLNKWRDLRRRRAARSASAIGDGLDELPAPESDSLAETEYNRYLANRAMELMRRDFQPTTWRACWEMVTSGRGAAEVAAELGISEGAVYVARCRVLRRLREELDGLLD